MDKSALLDSEDVDHGLKVPEGAIWIICATIFIDSLGGSISAPVLPFYAREFQVSDSEIGWLFSAFSLSQVVCLPLVGKLSDRIGRRPTLIFSLFGAALGAFSQAMAPSFGTLLAARIVSGGCGAVGSTANIYVADVTGPGNRDKYLGFLMSANGLAFAFGPGLGGGLSRFGLNCPILVDGALSLVAGLVAFAYLPESPAFARKQQDEAMHEQRDNSRWPAAVWAICVVELLRGFSFSGIFAMYAMFADKVYGLDSLHIGFAVCVGALVLICTNLWISERLTLSLGRVETACLGALLLAGGQVGLAYAPMLQASLVSMWIAYMGQAIAGCTIAAITSMLSSDSNRCMVMSLQQMAQAMGRVAGPFCLGYVSDVDPRLSFCVSAAAAAMASLILFCVRGAYARGVTAYSLTPDVDPSGPAWADEHFTQEDVEELGRFLCELLAANHYKWHSPEHREELKKTLRLTFPSVRGNMASSPVSGILHSPSMSYMRSPQEDALFAFSDAAAAAGGFVRSPPVSRRRYVRSTSSVTPSAQPSLRTAAAR